jgi:hypothetical protein
MTSKAGTCVLWRIEAPHMCCGFVEGPDGVIERAAPIIWWAKGKRRVDVVYWAWKRGYIVSGGALLK